VIYTITRYVIALLLGIVIRNKLKQKQKPIAKITVAMYVLLLMVISTITFFLPVENLFLTFPTPEKAAAYYLIGEITGIAEGKNSCLVLYGDSSSSIIPKTDNGYKIGTPFNITNIKTSTYYSELSSNQAISALARAKGTDDYYIAGVLMMDLDELEKNNFSISDSNSSEFEYTIDNIVSVNTKTINFHAFVGKISEDYCVYLNGEVIFEL